MKVCSGRTLMPYITEVTDVKGRNQSPFFAIYTAEHDPLLTSVSG
jgi:hypothetical protein